MRSQDANLAALALVGVVACSNPPLGTRDGGADAAGDTGADGGPSTGVWKPATGGPTPPGRFLVAGMEDRLLAFGGPAGAAQTWEFVGETWVQRNGAGSPPSFPSFEAESSWGGTLVGTKGKAVLVGGRVGGGACGTSSDCFAETWTYDVSTASWTKSPAAPPGCRTQSHAAFLGDKVLLIGGQLCAPPNRAPDALRWTGVSWEPAGMTNCNPSSGYSGGPVGAWPGAARLLYQHASGDTWSWDGSTCEHVTGPASGVTVSAGFRETFMTTDGSSLFLAAPSGVFEWLPDSKVWSKAGKAPFPSGNCLGIGAIGKRTLAGLWQADKTTVTYIWKG